MKRRAQSERLLRQTFAKNVRRHREKLGYSQETFADICGLHRTYISLVERSKRNISIDNIEIIAHGLKVNPSELLILHQET